MPRTKNVNPSYLLHSQSGQARVRIDGREHLLPGQFGSDESRIAYGQLIARHASGLPIESFSDSNRGKNSTKSEDAGPTVGEISLSFWNHAQTHYLKDGKQTSEIHCYRSCLKVLQELYGMTPAKDFGPLALKAVRASMVAGDPYAKDAEGKPVPRKPWNRTNVNTMVGRIRRVFKYAVENEMIDAAILTALQAVAPLLAGRTEAHDNAPRHAVDQDQIDAVRSLVSPLVRDLIDIQLLTGARSGELLMLTSGMIDRTGEVWRADLDSHKTIHHGKKRTLFFGPQCQLILTKYLSADPAAPLFRITRTAYCRAITRVCDKAGIERWTPHWMRHTSVTRIREQHGIEVAQAIAGHATTAMTDHYSAKMDKLGIEAARACG